MLRGVTVISRLHCPSSIKAYADLGRSRDPRFNYIVQEAAAAFGTPIALVSLLDEHRQWFKAKIGLAIDETPLTIAFCTYTILGDDVFEVADASRDERFARNPLVTGPPYIRFYAGAPLLTSAGPRIGTLCVIDNHTRSALSQEQKGYLAMLATKVVDLIEYGA